MTNLRTTTTLLLCSRQLISSATRRNPAAVAVAVPVPGSRSFQKLSLKSAVAHPITAHGPPPKAPSPAPEFKERTAPRAEAEAEADADAEDVQGNNNNNGTAASSASKPSKPSDSLKKRFWKYVDVAKKPEGEYHVLLDTRPVRTPTKDVLTIPSTKPQLAHAIALEWDVMTSARQALKSHLIPLTSLAARAADIEQEDVHGKASTREQVLDITMRYLDTDTLLCWVPEQEEVDGVVEAGTGNDGDSSNNNNNNNKPTESLREAQMKVAKDVIGYLSTKVWPGIQITPMLDTNSILPPAQPQATKDIIRNWISGLSAHDLAAFERGVLASKSLLLAARLLVEWSENFRHLQGGSSSRRKRFGIEEAAEASSLEVRWQTEMWGEVEDSHDVDKEDLKRQLGSVIVLVSGETR